jgi:LasA protease
VNPRVRYDPNRKRGQRSGGCLAGIFWMAVLAALAAGVLLFNSRPAAPAGAATAGNSSLQAIITVTPGPTATATPSATTPPDSSGAQPDPLATEAPLPTSTLLPPPSPSPTALSSGAGPAPTQYYITQSGDTMVALAARFGVNPADIVVPPPNTLRGTTTLAHGQLLAIPHVLDEVGPDLKLIPDSELVFSGAAAGFDAHEFAVQQGGFLAGYRGTVDDRTRPGGEVVLAAARNHSINPRLLMALLEYHSGWVSNPHPAGDALNFPYGFVHPYLRNLNAQLTWVTSRLAVGYYGWRAGTLTELQFPDGSRLRINPSLNAGTVALQYLFAQTRNRPEWDRAVSETGFGATYFEMFGDPFARALDPLLPADLTQVPLSLPFAPGQTWYYTGGPHGAWETGGAQAALDFAPPSAVSGCAESNAWVTAVAPGLVIRSSKGVVVLDLDGDGHETTGWNILYLHIATEGRVPEGTYVERGDRIGHPSCEGGQSTGTHVHIARKYNGEWILADGVIPFNLSGWVAAQGKGEYYGTLTRDGVTVEACTCTAVWTAITADR